MRTVPHTQLEAFLQNTGGIDGLPSAFIDFGMQPRDVERPQDPFAALLMLKRQLAHHQTRFPLYDFACVWYLRETGQLTQLHSFFPAEEMGFITELVNLLGRLPYVALANAVFAMMGKRWGHWFTVYRHRRKLDEAQVAAILQMDVQTELLEALPRLFAHDLNTMMAVPQAPHRLVLFFDTHEAFWGVRERESSRDRFFQRDEWFRQLLGYLDLPQGIVVVVAGRDTPRWAQASRATIPNTFVDTQLVGHLSATDAATYLERAGIVEPAMRDQLVHYTQVAPGQSHPFYLGLCTDVVLASLTRGVPLTPQDFHTAPQLEARTAELLDRLLRYVDVHVESAVRALSACRAFNWEIYLALGTALHFQATAAAFEVLCGFSFVWRAETSAEGWYRIHDLVRRIMHERPAKGIHQAHEVLEHYYRAKAATGDTAAGAEAIYHANHLDWERGVQEWSEVFKTALDHSDYEHCRVLLAVRNVLTVGTEMKLGEVSLCEGDYFFYLAQYEKARQEFTEAITAYDRALGQAPDNDEAQHNKGLALQKLGEVQAALAQYPEALASYQAAIAACDTTLERAPYEVGTHNNKGIALQSLGDVQASLAQYPEALASYQAAITVYDTVLVWAPNDIMTQSNKGHALQRLAVVHASLAQYPEALASHQAAITAYDRVLVSAPNDVRIQNNKGATLQSLGEVQASLTQYPEVLASYQAAITAYDRDSGTGT